VSLLTISDLDQPFENIKPYIDRAQSLGQMYFDYITNVDETQRYEVVDFSSHGRAVGIHASEMTKCFRQLVFSIAGVERKILPEQVDTNMQMRFKLGTAVHAMIQSDWKRIADRSNGLLEFRDEVKIDPKLQQISAEWNLHSSADGEFILNESFDKKRPLVKVGLEIKTEADDGFGKLKQPRPEHREQTCLYMAALDLPLMWLMYYNKNNSNITTPYAPFLLKFDKDLWENLLIRFAKATHMASMGQVPDPQEGHYCKWCSFAWWCQPKALKVRKKTVISPQMLPRRH